MNPISSIPIGANAGFQPLPLPKMLPKDMVPSPMPYGSVRELPSAQPIGEGAKVGRLDQVSTGQGSFDKALGRFVGEVNQKQTQAADAVHGLLNGQNVPLHQAVVSMEEASVSFQLMVEVRNKLLESYQELMRMQI